MCQLLQSGLHSTAQQAMSAALQAGRPRPLGEASGPLASPAAAQQSQAEAPEEPVPIQSAEPQQLVSEPQLAQEQAQHQGRDPRITQQRHQAPHQGSAAASGGDDPQQAQQQAQQAGKVQQASEEPLQVQQQAQQAQQAQQDLFDLLLEASDVAAAAAAGLTPELAASFMMLMHRLPPGEQASKVSEP